MDKGELVSDELIINLVKDRLTHDDCSRGFLFDGCLLYTSDAADE